MLEKLELDKTLHQPVRTKIVAYLANVGSSDYSLLKKTLGLSDGHMSTHMRELVSKNYVAVEKEFVNNKPKTTYYITKTGKREFKRLGN